MRSKLFVPGSRPELFAKAMAGPADAISIDLEDAVAPNRKDEARTAVSSYLASLPRLEHRKTIIVRVNGIGTPHFAADVAAVTCPAVDLINLPMAQTADEIRAAAEAIERAEAAAGLERPVGLLINIETPASLRRAVELATASPRVAGLQLGLADLMEPLGIDRTDERAVHHIQLATRLAAGEAGIWALDAAYANIADADGYRREADQARRLGFIGKSCIHPAQIAAANAAFQPTADEIAHAARVVAAAERARADGVGAFMVDGRMIDAPFIARAEAILAIGRELGLVEPGPAS